MENIMMEEWAQAVPDDGTVLHLGDLSYKSNAQFKHLIAPHLTGKRKILVMGNHDRARYSFYRDCGFKLAKPFYIRWQNYKVSFSHYPWSEDYEHEPFPRHHHIRIHGHIHNNGYTREAYVPFLRNHINLSVEQTHYRPVNLELLLQGYVNGATPKHPGRQHRGEGFASDRRYASVADPVTREDVEVALRERGVHPGD